MTSQIGDVAFDYSSHQITDKRAFNGVDETGSTNGLMLCFKTILDFAYSVMMAASVFGAIVGKKLLKHVIDNAILDLHLE